MQMRDAALEACEVLGDLSVEGLRADRIRALAIERLLTIFGEAAKRVPPEVRSRWPEMPWRQAAGTRDRITHDYDNVDLAIVHTIVSEELPRVAKHLQEAIDGFES